MQYTDKKNLKDQLQVYFIMGSPNCLKDPVLTLKEAIAGGITFFQFREKGTGALTGEEKIKLASELQEICRDHSIPFIVNDDVELAVKLEADGVHIGQGDEALHVVREKMPGKIIGLSAHTMEEVKAAIREGADYVGIGPIFPTLTKTDTKPVQGTKLIEEIRSSSLSIPIVGIGGIHAGNAVEVIVNGADGVSVITAISQAASPKEAAAQLKKVVLEKRK
ncbi:thiamine-phosphate pyrophosphorylase [Bacillus sp. FJAT-27231]|uniref:thiamine phosphate synthase n=1 Tax=Bacillus sp. FJAT-27231 TaxID=1679168 RepID=UPI00067179C2|nr:thiamine phosphate synthase [Bacillus sp. FJAT-27231]KMY53418.1 thiamine-phosphate pyrophosphorylase [Bacillus sp. FJAT-27231]